MEQLPSEILELILSYISDSDLLDLCRINENISRFCDSSFWSRKAVSKGYIKNLEDFGDIKVWPEGKVTERYIQVLSKRDCVPGSEKYDILWQFLYSYRSGKTGDIKTINYFLNKGCDSNSVLSGAVIGGHIDTVKYLIDKYLTNANNVLCRSSIEGNLEIVKYIIEEKGANNLDDALYKAAYGGHLEVVKYLIEKGVNDLDEALYKAATYGHLEVVKYLIAKGADNLDEALEVAIERKYTEIIEYLEKIISQRT